MITVTQIISALSGQLRTLGYPVKDVDITKDIPRPCLTVEAEHISCEATASDYCGETVTLAVYYFAERREKGYAELLKCHDDLQTIFRESHILFKITATSIQCSSSDLKSKYTSK